MLISSLTVFLKHKVLSASPLTDLSIRYPPAVYVNIFSHSFKHKVSMLTSPLTVLGIIYPPAVYVNCSSHSFKHKISINSLC